MILHTKLWTGALCLIAVCGLLAFYWDPGGAPESLTLESNPEQEHDQELPTPGDLKEPLAPRNVQEARESVAPRDGKAATIPAKMERGELAGKVMLLNGDPAPNVVVSATLLPQSPGGMHSPITAIANGQGAFRFPSIPAGPRELSVESGLVNGTRWPLELQGTRTFSTGSKAIELRVNAITLQVETLPLEDNYDMIQKLRCSRVDESGLVDRSSAFQEWDVTYESRANGVVSTNRKTLTLSQVNDLLSATNQNQVPQGRIGHATFVVPTGSAYVLRESQSSDRSRQDFYKSKFSALLDNGCPSSTIMLVLEETPSAFGKIKLRIDQPALPDKATLSAFITSFNGSPYIPHGNPIAQAKYGFAELSIGGLLPGKYKLRVDLQSAGLVQLLESSINVDIGAGVTEVYDLKSSEWGVLRVRATAPGTVKSSTFAQLSVQKPDQDQWIPLALHTREEYPGGSQTVRRSAVLVNGAAGVSDPLPPGEYRLRLALPGHATLEQSVHVRPGENKVALALRLE